MFYVVPFSIWDIHTHTNEICYILLLFAVVVVLFFLLCICVVIQKLEKWHNFNWLELCEFFIIIIIMVHIGALYDINLREYMTWTLIYYCLLDVCVCLCAHRAFNNIKKWWWLLYKKEWQTDNKIEFCIDEILIIN